MSARWDLAAYDRDNQLVLVVEVKSKLDVSTAWAAKLPRNILAHGAFQNARYFLMVFPDRFFLWENSDSNYDSFEPTYVIDTGPVLKPYFDHSDISAAQVSGQCLELIVSSWLYEIIHKNPDELEPSQQWLIDSGLYSAIVDGSLEHEVPA